MSTRKTGTRTNEDFKRTLVDLYHNGKLKPHSLKSTAYLKLLLPNGLSSIQPLKWMMERFSLPSKSKNFKNVWLSLKKKTKYKKRLPYSRHTQATIRSRT